MAEKLRYDVEVNTRDGVSELERLGKAGKEAGDDISSGFDETESKAQSAASALVSAAQEIEQALKADAEAADALAQALGPELSGKIDTSGAVAELKKLGLTADDIKAEADTLGLALKEIDDINMGSIKGDMTKLGGAVDDVDSRVRKMGDTSDNSRSVMANLAGNAAQDNFTALGGAAGSAGVAIGQLAEYASEGNISLTGLAAVAGPMLLLAGATQLVTSRMERVAKIDAWKKEQVESYKEAVQEVGVGVGAVQRHLEGLEDWSFDTGGDWHDFMTSEGKLVNINAALGVMGFTLTEVAGYIESGSTGAAQFEEKLNKVGLGAEGAGLYIEWLAEQQNAYAFSTGNAAAETDFFESSLQSMMTSLGQLRTENIEQAAAWDTLMQAQYQGNMRTQESLDLWNELRQDLNLTEQAMAELFDQKYTQYYEDQAAATGEATDAAVDHTAALEDEAAAMEEAATAAQEAADAQRAARDAVYALEGAQEDLNDARAKYLEDAEEYGDTSTEAGRSLRDLRDAAIDVADAEVELARERAAANRVIYSSVDAIDDENAALLRQAGTLQGPARQAILQHIDAVNDIPDDVMTEIATLVEAGQYAEAQALLDDVSGRRDLAIDAQVNEASAKAAKNRIDAVAEDQTADVHVNVDTTEAADKIRRLRTLIYGAQQAARMAAGPTPTMAPTSAPAAASSTVVTLNLPRGTRPDDAVRAIDNYARRNGSTRARR